MTTRTYSTYIERDGEEILIEVGWIIENDGIGSYEFWGQQCYDAGHNYPVVEEARLEDGTLIDLTDAEVNTIEERLVDVMEDLLAEEKEGPLP